MGNKSLHRQKLEIVSFLSNIGPNFEVYCTQSIGFMSTRQLGLSNPTPVLFNFFETEEYVSNVHRGSTSTVLIN